MQLLAAAQKVDRATIIGFQPDLQLAACEVRLAALRRIAAELVDRRGAACDG